MNHPLLSRQVLIGLGLCLAMLGLVLLGRAGEFRRDAERRRQHLRAERKSGQSGEHGLGPELEDAPSWLEKNFDRIANFVLGLGVLITIAGWLSAKITLFINIFSSGK